MKKISFDNFWIRCNEDFTDRCKIPEGHFQKNKSKFKLFSFGALETLPSLYIITSTQTACLNLPS